MIGIDVFSGAGGMSLGARNAGIDVQLALDMDKYAAATYVHNHKPLHGFYVGDIRNFKVKPIETGGKQTVVFGGPPCQGFSTSNQKTRSADNANNWLFEEFIRVVKEHNPDWVVFENVRGILEFEGGAFVDRVINQLETIGYTTSSKLLHANKYGIPQKRARFFIVGSRHGVKLDFPLCDDLPNVSVEEAIGDLPILSNGASTSYLEYRSKPKSSYAEGLRGQLEGCHNHLVTCNSQYILDRYPHVRQGENWEAIPISLMGNYKDRSRCHTGIYRRLKANEPSIVIGNYRKNMLIHPVQDRGLSVREAARIQSFPDSYRFMGSIGFQQQQVGNAVPPMLAKYIFSKIKEH